MCLNLVLIEDLVLVIYQLSITFSQDILAIYWNCILEDLVQVLFSDNTLILSDSAVSVLGDCTIRVYLFNIT